MAHKKGAGSTNNGRDSISKRLGVKLYGGQPAIAGNIIVRQRGTKFHPGTGVGLGKDHTIFAMVDGTVSFIRKRNNRTYVSVLPEAGNETVSQPKVVKPAKPKKEKPSPAPVKEPVKAEASAEKEEPKKKAAPAEKADLNEEDAVKAQKDMLSSIGEGSEDNKDDLKKISGVGPVLEEKLNSLGIYTFAQVSKMTKKEYDLMDSLTKSFPGRAERDDWAGQAKKLMSA